MTHELSRAIDDLNEARLDAEDWSGIALTRRNDLERIVRAMLIVRDTLAKYWVVYPLAQHIDYALGAIEDDATCKLMEELDPDGLPAEPPPFNGQADGTVTTETD